MTVENSKSRMRGVRVLIPHDDYLQEKALKNPDNKYNQVGTEINLLIEKDFKKAKSKK